MQIVETVDSIENSTLQAFSTELTDSYTRVSCKTNKNMQIIIPKSAQESISQKSIAGGFIDSVNLTAAEIYHGTLKAEEKENENKPALFSWFVEFLIYLRDRQARGR